jgi:hypothetical protein
MVRFPARASSSAIFAIPKSSTFTVSPCGAALQKTFPGLDVPMHDPRRVRFGQGRAQRGDDLRARGRR